MRRKTVHLITTGLSVIMLMTQSISAFAAEQKELVENGNNVNSKIQLSEEEFEEKLKTGEILKDEQGKFYIKSEKVSSSLNRGSAANETINQEKVTTTIKNGLVTEKKIGSVTTEQIETGKLTKSHEYDSKEAAENAAKEEAFENQVQGEEITVKSEIDTNLEVKATISQEQQYELQVDLSNLHCEADRNNRDFAEKLSKNLILILFRRVWSRS